MQAAAGRSNAASRFVSGFHDGSLIIWRAADGQRERKIDGACFHSATLACWPYALRPLPTPGHGWGAAVRAVADLGGGRIISGATDRKLRIWRLADGVCERVARLLARAPSPSSACLPPVPRLARLPHQGAQKLHQSVPTCGTT